MGKKYTEETGRGRYIVVLKRCGNKTGDVGIFLQLFKSSLCNKTNPAPFRVIYSMMHEGELHTPAPPSEREDGGVVKK